MRDYMFIKLPFGIKSLFYFYYSTVHLFIKDLMEKYYYYHILKVVSVLNTCNNDKQNIISNCYSLSMGSLSLTNFELGLIK